MKPNRFFYTLIVIAIFQSCSSYKNKNTMKYKFDFQTQYSGFYITSDNGGIVLTPGALELPKEESEGRLIQAKNTLIVKTGSYGHIRGEMAFLNTKREEVDYDKYDHIVEAGLDVHTGELQILDCPNSHVEFKKRIKPGIYGVRIYSSGLKTSDFSEQEGDDRYLIEIWPDSTTKWKVLKQYSGY
jgi:hypothetical protein